MCTLTRRERAQNALHAPLLLCCTHVYYYSEHYRFGYSGVWQYSLSHDARVGVWVKAGVANGKPCMRNKNRSTHGGE